MDTQAPDSPVTGGHFNMGCRIIDWSRKHRWVMYCLCRADNLTPAEESARSMDAKRRCWLSAEGLMLEGRWRGGWEAEEARYLRDLLHLLEPSTWGVDSPERQEVEHLWLLLLWDTAITTVKDLQRHIKELLSFCTAIVEKAAT